MRIVSNLILASVLSLTLAGAASAESECVAAFKKAVAGKKQELNPRLPSARTITKKAYREYSDIAGGVDESDLEITERTLYVTLGKVVGYKLVVTDGGDESDVAMWFDPAGNLLRTHWYNQSPVTNWVCENY